MIPSLENFRERLANIIISASTLRNQGAPGVIDTARDFLKNLDLEKFVTDNERDFLEELDRQTLLLKHSFPLQAQHWGAARKAINLFLAESFYHRFVCASYHLEKIESFLETPLDSQVGKFLFTEAMKRGVQDLPRWQGLKHLTLDDSRCYQDFANQLAKDKGYARVFLDVTIWQPKGP